MPLTRCELTYEVDWNDSGDYTDAGDDVTDDVTSFDVRFGGQPRANPDRPTLEPATGHLALFGDRYIRGKHGALPRDVLLKRHRVRVRCGAETIWTGWMQTPRSSNQRTVSWELEGLLAKGLSDQVDVEQLDTSGTTLDAAVLADVAGAVGASAVSPLQLPSTNLGIYDFEGPGGEYVSSFAAVAGGIPVETAAGGLGIVSPTANPMAQGTLRGDHLVIRSVQAEPAVEHLRNVVEVETVDVDIETDMTGTLTAPTVSNPNIYDGSWPPAAGDYHDQAIAVDLPELSGADRYTAASFAATQALANWRQPTSGGVVTSNRLADNLGAAFDAVQVAITKPEGGVAAATVTIPGANIAALRTTIGIITYWVAGELRISYTLTTTKRVVLGTTTHEARDTTSIADWGERAIQYPAWFRAPITASLAQRVAGLKDPRRFITVTLPLWQRDQSRLEQVRDYAPGDYLGLHVTDGPSDVYLNDRVVVLAVGYRQRGRRIPTKTLHLLETGMGAVFDHFTWGTSEWGGGDTWG